jgi:hypothetical protein
MPLGEFIHMAVAHKKEEICTDPSPKLESPETDNWDVPQEIKMDDPDYAISPEREFEYYSPFIDYTSAGSYVPPLRLDISDDIDDEQINGRNRRRKRKARTNTR